MAEVYKVLGQLDPSANTLTKLYTVPAATSTINSSIFISNRNATATAFSMQVRVAGAAADNKQYIYTLISIPGNETFVVTAGVTLAATDEVWVLGVLATCSFNMFGTEIS